MEANLQPPEASPLQVTASSYTVCPVCHQPVTPNEFFCPNCGASLHQKPLSTSATAQAGIYAFSIVLPIICFIMVTKWQGIKYVRSDDPKARQIGLIACGLLIISTIITIWLGVVWAENITQQTINGLNADTSINGV